MSGDAPPPAAAPAAAAEAAAANGGLSNPDTSFTFGAPAQAAAELRSAAGGKAATAAAPAGADASAGAGPEAESSGASDLDGGSPVEGDDAAEATAERRRRRVSGLRRNVSWTDLETGSALHEVREYVPSNGRRSFSSDDGDGGDAARCLCALM